MLAAQHDDDIEKGFVERSYLRCLVVFKCVKCGWGKFRNVSLWCNCALICSYEIFLYSQMYLSTREVIGILVRKYLFCKSNEMVGLLSIILFQVYLGQIWFLCFTQK